MRTTTLPTLLLSTSLISAQPVLQYANVALLGNNYNLYVVTDPGSSDPNIDGANVTWDFSSATTVLAGTCSFVAPDGTPFAASYPSSNLAQSVTVAGATSYNYLNLQPAQLDMLAEDVGGADEIVYTDPKTPLQFPFAFNNYFIDYFTYDGTNYSVSRAYMGYGTVILPIGTFTDVVKMASTSGAINFFRSNPVEPLVSIEDDGTVIVWENTGVGLGETPQAAALSTYPNPAADRSRVEGIHGANTWHLMDTQGREQLAGRGNTGAPLSLDLSNISSGTYLLIINDAAGRRAVHVVKR